VQGRDDELGELLEEVRRIDVMSRRLVNDVMAGGYMSAFRGAGLEFDRVREYVPGDPRRLVDWNVTARTGKPFVKTFVDERELTVLFVLDLSASMLGGFGHWSARQTAARVCACLAFAAVRSNDKTGLVAFSGDVDAYVPPAKGVGHALRIVRDCIALRGADRRTDLGPALEFAARVVRKHAVVLVVSDFLAPPEEWRRPMTLAARRHDVIAVRVLPPDSVPAEAGLVRVHDPETGAERLVDWGSPRVRAAFEEQTRARDEGTRDALRRAGVDRMDVPLPRGRDPEAIARPILKFFRMRERRGAKR